MAYSTTADIAAEVGENNLIPFLADNGEQTFEDVTGTLEDIISVADASIDGRIANIYTVPVSPTVPLLRYASVIFTCEILYRRRLSPAEKNPYTSEADRLRERLDKIGAGELNLDLNIPRDFSQGALAARSTIYGVQGSNNPFNTM